jgi:TfoX/Sxy family transcriptional regulator of competence genes
MVYDENLDARLQKIILQWKNTSKKKMFGGICYLLNGNMVGGVYKDSIFLRLGEKNAIAALELPNIKDFDITGRPMKGWVMAAQNAFKNDSDLVSWLEKAKKFVETLPPK